MADDNRRSRYHALYEGLTLGFLFPLAIGIGFVSGRWLDGVFGTRPWLTVIMTGCGIAAAFVHLFRAGKSSDGTPNGPSAGS